jgi:hypothetical protein
MDQFKCTRRAMPSRSNGSSSRAAGLHARVRVVRCHPCFASRRERRLRRARTLGGHLYGRSRIRAIEVVVCSLVLNVSRGGLR